MESQSSPLKEHLLELIDPTTTPEKALQSLSHPCFKTEAYTKGHIEPVVIFLAYIRFIIKRRPDSCVDGIWEKMLRITLMYSRNISRKDITCFLNISTQIQSIYSRVVPTEEIPVSIWVSRALRSKINCTNPYTRLELFRLLRIYERDWRSGRNAWNWKPICFIDWSKLCETFIHTVSEMQPHRLYPSGNTDDLMFCVTDMKLFLRNVINEELLEVNSRNIIKNLNTSNELFVNSTETRFISHCIQSIGVFAVLAKSNPDFDKHITEIIDCFHILKMIVKGGGTLDNSEGQLYVVNLEEQLHYVVALPPFRDYIIEALRDLSAAIMNCCERNLALLLAYLRDIFVWNLGVNTDTNDLPCLLLSRQSDGPTAVHRHLLLFKNMRREDWNLDEFDFEEDNDWFDIFIRDYMNRYLQYYDSDSESDNINNSSRSSDNDDNNWEESLSSIDSNDNDENITSSNDTSEYNTDTSHSDASYEDNDHSNE